MGDFAQRQNAGSLVVVDRSVLEIGKVGPRRLLDGGKTVAPHDETGAIGGDHKRRQREDGGDAAGDDARGIAAKEEGRDLQHHVAEHAAEAGGSGQVGGGVTQPAMALPARKPRTMRRRGAACDRRRAPRGRDAPDGGGRQSCNGGEAVELHGEIGKHRARIAHRVGDEVVGGVAEARVGDVPRAEARQSEGDDAQQRQARGAAELAAQEGLDAESRAAHRERCRCPRAHASFPVRELPLALRHGRETDGFACDTRGGGLKGH